MLTFLESVKKAQKKRAGWEKHKALNIGKLVPRGQHKKMKAFFNRLSDENLRAKVDRVPGVGTVLYFPTPEPQSIHRRMGARAEELGVRRILHMEVREKELTFYACLEDLR